MNVYRKNIFVAFFLMESYIEMSKSGVVMQVSSFKR
jgi:hypothetical protein